MEEKTFIWTSELTKRLFKLRFEHDWLFKKKKQPWREFRKILLENGFPEEMTVNHVRKKWSYTYDMYQIAKRTKNKDWKYYKMFDKHYSKSKSIYEKYPSWSDDWRLKLITCVTETKEHKLDFQTMWRAIERAMRCQDLPIDCCVHDMKGLWQNLRTTFNRKHRIKIKKGSESSDWPLYDAMLSYYQNHELENLIKLESENYMIQLNASSKYCKKMGVVNDKNDNETDEFQWSKDITETFIQIRLQNDWLFRERKWAWNELVTIMRSEHGFPKTLTSRDLCRKWSAIFGEYQKSKATNNKQWLYYNLFELYLGEGSLSLNPLIGWQEEWVFNFISARTDLEHLFKFSYKDQTEGWREVEKRLRNIGLPLDHSLLDLPEIWAHLLKTYKWKHKFASKGMLNEPWPYYEAMAQYLATQQHAPVKTQRRGRDLGECDGDDGNDDFEDDMKLFDLKQRLKQKTEVENQCRSCNAEDGCVNIFERTDEGLELADKLRIIAGVEVDKSDNLPSQICFNCFRDLDTAYKFRLKCQEIDKLFRNHTQQIKIEVLDKIEDDPAKDYNNTKEEYGGDDLGDMDFEDIISLEPSKKAKVVKKEKVMRRKKGPKKLRYDYWKICEVCGKHTRNLISHLDMHAEGKAYSCNVCDKTFKFKSGLLIHKAIHNSTPKKTCPVCGKTFHIMAQFRKHFVYHANERNFECETCGKRFNTLDILRVHNRMHTGERPFKCPECDKTFRTAGCVSRHRRIVHRGTKLSTQIQCHCNLRLWWVAALLLVCTPHTFCRNVTHEDIRDAMLSLVHMFRTSEDKLERHEYREKGLGDQLKRMLSGLDKKHRALEPLKGMISRLDERLSNVETILLQKEEREKTTQQKTNDALDAIQKSLQTLTTTVSKGLRPSAEDNLTTNDDSIERRLDATDAKLDAVKTEIEKLKNSLSKEALHAMCLEVSSSGEHPLGKHISEAEKLLNKYELKLNEYNVNASKVPTDFVPLSEVALADDAWHSKMSEVMERQEKEIIKIKQLLGDAEGMWKDLPRQEDLKTSANQTLEAIEKVKEQIKESEEKTVSKLTTKLREMSDRLAATNQDIQASLTQSNVLTERVYNDISRSYDTLRTEVQTLTKSEHVMLTTADNVLSTKKLVEYGIQQILVDVGERIRAHSNHLNKTINERFESMGSSLLDNQLTTRTNLSDKIESEMAPVWRQIGIMYKQLTANKESLDKLTEQTVLYVNGSASTMENIDNKVGMIKSRMSEVDDNLNYLLGRLSLVTQEFSQIKIGLGEALEKAKTGLSTVQAKLEEADKGPGPHNITSEENKV
ncbi:uncharacterized protein LOC128675603 [Plodia interpunctella]|uniref:uncharacterized protein LOC128675603 n=1 Tax=Plodia interpunctella TaxID=58824 RepID=UPI0023681C3E|nr:uncharacterized protein LOC128675603 [Plodia interpunctella]